MAAHRRLPAVRGPDGIELKFNPWHDPQDGRFTFAGQGRHYGAGGSDKASDGGGHHPTRVARTSRTNSRDRSHSVAPRKAGTPPGTDGTKPAERGRGSDSTPVQQPNPITEFVGRVSQGIHDVAEGSATSLQAVLTTNPAATIRHAGREIAGMIDTVIAAEDTPARDQVSRAADAIAHASARDVGHAAGSVAGNVAFAIAPGAALGKVAALRRLRVAAPRDTFEPPQIGWVKETQNSKEAWKAYNDAATGARPGQAPSPMRTMPDGSKRSVKFDGVDGDYMIDRK